MEVGGNIKKVRELRNYSQKALANEINVSQKQISRIENNDVSPTMEQVFKICNFLNVTIQELLDFTENNIFNNINTQQQGGEFVVYNNTEIEQIKSLYERLLKEKDEVIAVLKGGEMNDKP